MPTFILCFGQSSSVLNIYLVDYVGYRVAGQVFLLTILFLSLFFKRGPILLVALLFALIWDYFFVPPVDSFKIAAVEDIGFTILLFLVALVMGALSNRVKTRQELLRKNEQSTQAIYEISKAIGMAPTAQALFETVKEKLGRILQGKCEILVRGQQGELNFDKAPLLEDDKERAVATWVFENGQEAGWSTSTLPSVKNLYIPLKGFKEAVGVLSYRPTVDRALLPEQKNFIYTVAQQLAGFLERTFSAEREQKNEQIRQIEQIYAKVLQSISDELYRPLKIMQTAVEDLKEERAVSDNLKLFSSLIKMEKTSESLIHLAENASAMAKLSGGFITFEKAYHDVETLIHECVHKIQKFLRGQQIRIIVERNVPPVPFDFTLMTILLHHLLTNAIEYSPPDSTIEIDAEVFDGMFVLSVLDEGKGIPEDMMELVFEKFYRLRGTVSTGLGLGLAIVKSIAEIHHADIKVQNRPHGGTKFSLLLPL